MTIFRASRGSTHTIPVHIFVRHCFCCGEIQTHVKNGQVLNEQLITHFENETYNFSRRRNSVCTCFAAVGAAYKFNFHFMYVKYKQLLHGTYSLHLLFMSRTFIFICHIYLSGNDDKAYLNICKFVSIWLWCQAKTSNIHISLSPNKMASEIQKKKRRKTNERTKE